MIFKSSLYKHLCNFEDLIWTRVLINPCTKSSYKNRNQWLLWLTNSYGKHETMGNETKEFQFLKCREILSCILDNFIAFTHRLITQQLVHWLVGFPMIYDHNHGKPNFNNSLTEFFIFNRSKIFENIFRKKEKYQRIYCTGSSLVSNYTTKLVFSFLKKQCIFNESSAFRNPSKYDERLDINTI